MIQALPLKMAKLKKKIKSSLKFQEKILTNHKQNINTVPNQIQQLSNKNKENT